MSEAKENKGNEGGGRTQAAENEKNPAEEILASGTRSSDTAEGGSGRGGSRSQTQRRKSFSRGSAREALGAEPEEEPAGNGPAVESAQAEEPEVGTESEHTASGAAQERAEESAPQPAERTGRSGGEEGVGLHRAATSPASRRQSGTSGEAFAGTAGERVADESRRETEGGAPASGEPADGRGHEAGVRVVDPVVDDLVKSFTVEDTDRLLEEISALAPQTRALNKTTINLSHRHARLLSEVKLQLKVAGFNGNEATTSNVMAVGLMLYKRILDLDAGRTEE